MLTDPLFCAAVIPAVILLGLAKDGFSGIGVLAAPLMTLVVSPVQDAVSVWIFRKTWDKKSLAILNPSACGRRHVQRALRWTSETG